MTMTRFDDPTEMTEGERFRELVSILAAGCVRLRQSNIPTDITHSDPLAHPSDSDVAPPSKSSFNLSKQLDYSGEPSLHYPGGLTPDRE